MSLQTPIIDQYQGTERRHSPRWEVNNRIMYQIDEGFDIKEGTAKNLTCSGIGFTTNEDLAPFQKVKITFFLMARDPISAKGTVCWSKSENGQYFVGVVFNSPNHQTQDLILQYALETNKNSVINHWFKGW